MTEHRTEPHYAEGLQGHFQQVQRLLEKHAVATAVTLSPEAPDAESAQPALQPAAALIGLHTLLKELHPADIAGILAALPIEQRLLVWSQVETERDGEILIEVAEAVRASLLTSMSRDTLRAAAAQLDSDEIAVLAQDLPQPVMRDVFKSLSVDEREQLRAAMSHPPDAVAALMDFDMLTIRADVTLEAVARYLRRFDILPSHTDQLFVVDRDDQFQGTLPLNKLLRNEPGLVVSALMDTDTITLRPDDKGRQAAQAFERYNLVSAPVVDEDGKLLGRVTINAVVDFIRAESENNALHRAGLQKAEDPFASIWKSAQNRWLWLALNLCSVFIAARVISSFADSIKELVALAVLMPIVAGSAAYTGNQTATLITRFLALGQVHPADTRRLLGKELAVSALHGLVWGGSAGGFAYLLYQNLALALLVTGAMLLTQLLGALAGTLIPLTLQKFGRDPAAGASVLLGTITTSGGFLIFLGLANVFLLH